MRPDGRRYLVGIGAAIALSSCAGASVTWTPATIPATLPTPAAQVFVVMAAGPRRVEQVAGAARTVVAVGLPAPMLSITSRVLAIVRERYPTAQIIETPFEEPASAMALQRSATHLLIPSVLEWREGARQGGEGDRIEISLRLVRIERTLAPPASIITPEGRLPAALITAQGEIVYRARASGVAAAFSRENAAAQRLLDQRFREAVLQLLAGRPSSR